MPRGLAELAEQSTAIVVAKVLVAPSDATEGFSVDEGLARMTGFADVPGFPNNFPNVPPPPTSVQAQTISCLKGNLTGKFSAIVELPHYRVFNYGAPPVQLGDTALFFLRREENKWNVVDGTQPGLRLTANTKKMSEAITQAEAAPQGISRLVPLLAASLEDAAMRPTFLFQLLDIEDARVKEALLPYINEPNEQLRDFVLVGLAANQYVEVIPRIVAFARDKWRKDRTTPMCVEAIGKIRSPKAIAALNRLLFDESPYTRLSAIMALRPIADESSIPFLMVALRDPEPQRMVCYDAYATLSRLADIPLYAIPYYEKHQDEVTEPLYEWYADRLEAGKNRQTPLN